MKFRQSVSQIKVLNKRNIGRLVESFNTYRSKVAYVFEARENSGQENLQSTMMEEFFKHLLRDLVIPICGQNPPNMWMGKGKGYVDLTFSPSSYSTIFNAPTPYLHSKDQDFLLGAKFIFSLKADTGGKDVAEVHNEDFIVPVVAIECKTYLERNMLDSCANTASRLKKAMPYCLYIVAAEYLKLETAQPELTDIDEVFILCKATNSARLTRKKMGKPVIPLDTDLIIDIFEMVKRHLNGIWWQPESVLKSGKVINRPL